MKRFVLAAALATAIISISSNAFAASISVDVPFQFTFKNEFLNADKNAKPKDKSVSDVNGFILTVTKGWLGVGYERYEVNAGGKTIDVPSQSFDIRMTYQFYDVLLDFPFPVINLALGYGAGRLNTQLSGTNVPAIGETGATQTFARLGIPIGPLFDLHVGYHVIKTEPAKFKANGGTDKLSGDGSTLTAGVRVGW